MNLSSKYKVSIINLLISTAVSLIVNFSFFIFLLMPAPSMTPANNVSAEAAAKASRFVNIDNPHLFLTLQVVFYIVLAFILLSIFTAKVKEEDNDNRKFIIRILYCTLLTTVIYFLCPIVRRIADSNEGVYSIMMFANHKFNPMIVLRCSFVLIVAILYGKIFALVYQKQNVTIENEMLKNENLQTRYNMLISQINPHFFFNSLNSLSMLVREKHNDNALTYIDRLSDTFRYIIQNRQNEMTTLGQELEFLTAYKYLHEVRYADKLFFDIDVPEKFINMKLPTMSLQPLIENAVKHNMITSHKPLHVTIKVDGEYLTVSNHIIPKIEMENGTGIGLQNLSSRFMLLIGKEIVVNNTGDIFKVELPLT